jgi:hypothetical protein
MVGRVLVARMGFLRLKEVAGVPNNLAGVVHENETNSPLDALPEWLQIALKEKPTSFKLRLANTLEKLVDACFGEENLRLGKQLEKHSNKTLWRVLQGVARGTYPLHIEKNLDLHRKRNNTYRDGGEEPLQPLANGQENVEQNAGSGSTGGSAKSDEKEMPPKKDNSTVNPNQLSANEGEHTAKTPPMRKERSSPYNNTHFAR